MGNIITGGTLPQVTIRGTKGVSPSDTPINEMVYTIERDPDKRRFIYDSEKKKLLKIPPYMLNPKLIKYGVGYTEQDSEPVDLLGSPEDYPIQTYNNKLLDGVSEYANGLKHMFDTRRKIIRHQEGGQLSTTQQQGLQYLAQMYAQQTGKNPQSDQEGFMQFVQQLAQQAGVQDIGQLLDMIYQQAQGQAQAAKRGAKLNYLKRLSDKCPEGTELRYFASGGQVCSKCIPIQKQKCGSKMKKKKACNGIKVKF